MIAGLFSVILTITGSKAEYLISTWLVMDKKHLTFQINVLFYAEA